MVVPVTLRLLPQVKVMPEVEMVASLVVLMPVVLEVALEALLLLLLQTAEQATVD